MTQITESWFNHPSTFDTYKLPTVENYRISTVAEDIVTLEGTMRSLPGHYVMTGPKGEQYPISDEKFAALKTDLGNGKCTPKQIGKLARLADHDGEIVTGWGNMQYTAGNDYIVRHGLNDYGAVKKDIFVKTYSATKLAN